MGLGTHRFWSFLVVAILNTLWIPSFDETHLEWIVQAIDKVVPFLKKCLYLVASKLSLEVVPFCKTQANSGDHSATMFLSVFVFFLAFSLGLGI